MSGPAAAIPYERQTGTQANRDCGAACLSMVYRSLGKKSSQDEIWPAIAKQNRFGSIASTTHLMTMDALSRGFAAVAFQARDPLQALRLCCESGTRAILNHRLDPGSAAGHYTVLVNIDHRSVVLHDPFHGPSRCLSHGELLELWQPRFPNAEIAGNMLIGIATEPSVLTACQLCRTPTLPSVECPKCKKPVGLQPSALLACMSSTCLARMWNYVCCPSCDFTWTFSLHTPPATGAAASNGTGNTSPSSAMPATPAAPAAEPAPLNLDAMFAALDKFCNHIVSNPTAANHPEVKQQLEFIKTSREKLTLANAEALAHRKTHQDQMAAMQRAAKELAEAHRKKMEELNRPSPPLDASALGRALLKNLGMDGTRG